MTVRRPLAEKPHTMVGCLYGSSSHIMHMNDTDEKPT